MNKKYSYPVPDGPNQWLAIASYRLASIMPASFWAHTHLRLSVRELESAGFYTLCDPDASLVQMPPTTNLG